MSSERISKQADVVKKALEESEKPPWIGKLQKINLPLETPLTELNWNGRKRLELNTQLSEQGIDLINNTAALRVITVAIERIQRPTVDGNFPLGADPLVIGKLIEFTDEQLIGLGVNKETHELEILRRLFGEYKEEDL